MPRIPNQSDAFTAIAEPGRRRVLGALARDEGRDVTGLVQELGWPQPRVSKSLGVLRRAGLVTVERRGRRRVYRVNGGRLRSVYDWVRHFERFWESQLERVRARAERIERESRSARESHNPLKGEHDDNGHRERNHPHD
ncbi:MAG: helix-turn-helix transcriptional regulator [Phycisphaerales bacterium]|nr:helix-turn-helix transcriptional regulator [Phycisphaerales bacterium]